MDITGEHRVPLPARRSSKHSTTPRSWGGAFPDASRSSGPASTSTTRTWWPGVGPVKARFRTRIAVSNLSPPESYTLSGEGRGGAAGFASGSADVSLEAVDGETVLRYTARIRPGGKIAQVGSRLIGGAARKIGNDFFSRFVEVVTPAPHREQGEPVDQEE